MKRTERKRLSLFSFHLILFFTTVSFSCDANAAHRMGTMDSLIYQLHTLTSKDGQVTVASEFLNDALTFDSVKTISYCNLIIRFGDSIHNINMSLLGKAYCFFRKHNMDSSFYYYKEVTAGLSRNDQLETKVTVEYDFLHEIGMADKTSLYRYSFELIRDATILKKYDLVADAYMNQNLVCVLLNINAALALADSSIKYAYLANDKERICNRLGLKAQTFMMQSNYDSAIFYVLKGLDLVKNFNGFSYARASGSFLLLDCYVAKKDTAKFFENIYSFCDYGESTPLPYWKLPALRYRAMANAYKKQFKEAIKKYQYIINNPDFTSRFFEEDIVDIYYSLSECYGLINDFKNSYLYLKTSDSLFKKLNNLKQANNLRDLEAFQLAEKQQSIDQLREEKLKVGHAELQKQKLQRNYLIGGLGILLLVIFLIVYNRRKIVLLNGQLAIAKVKAEQSEKYKQQFLSNMSHEIRSPMNAVLGAVNLAVENETGEKNKKHLYIAQRSAQHLLRIINDVLDISKIEAGKLSLEQIPFSINTVVNDVVAAQKIKADEKGIELIAENNLSENDTLVIGDQVRLNQVLTNLVNNAVKFTKHGTVKLKLIGTRTESSISNLQFLIEDTGIGMNKEELENLFAEYSQATVSTSRKFGGTGLGLNISKQLVELMNGTIDVQSEEGKGTSFTVRLPFAKASHEKIVSSENKSYTETWRESLKNLSLILADDIEDSRTITRDLLLQYIPTLNIQLAENGEEVISLLKHHASSMNLILLDLDMPIMNGYEATQKIRNELKLDIPIIALTASIMSLNKNELSQFGIDDVIAKPFVPKDLFEVMERVIKEKHQS